MLTLHDILYRLYNELQFITNVTILQMLCNNQFRPLQCKKEGE